MNSNRIDNRTILPPGSDDDDEIRPQLPLLRTFIVRRQSVRLPEVLVTAHGYDTDNGVARFFIFAVEMRSQAGGLVIVQYICRSFKEWTDIEELHQASGLAH